MGGVKKEYLPLGEKNLTVLGAAVAAFTSCTQIGPIVITVPAGEENAARAKLPPELLDTGPYGREGRIFLIPGGRTRRASVYNALLFLEAYHPSHVLIHDGARPWIKQNLIERIIDAVILREAVIPALPLLETPKELGGTTDEPAIIKRHLRRENLCAAQTPQGFRFPEILRAHEKAAEKEEAARNAGENFEYTDDAEVWGEFIGQVAVIPGDVENRKITYPEDLRYVPK